MQNRGGKNYPCYFGGSLLWLQYNVPQNPRSEIASHPVVLREAGRAPPAGFGHPGEGEVVLGDEAAMGLGSRESTSRFLASSSRQTR